MTGRWMTSPPPAKEEKAVPIPATHDLARKTDQHDTRRSLRTVPLGFVCGVLWRPMARRPACAGPAACLLHVPAGRAPQHPPLIDREERSRVLFAPGFAPSRLVTGWRL